MPPKTTPPQEAPALAGAVLLNQPEADQQPAIEDLTFVDVTGLAFARAEAYLQASELPSAKREYALAKTALEDAIHRFNRGRAMDLGCFNITDLEDTEFLAFVQEIREGGGGE